MNEGSSITIALISAVSGIIIAYIVNIAAKKTQDKKAKKQPKDRMEQMFDGYERLIAQKDKEDDRKQKAMKALEEELSLTRQIVIKLENALEDTQHELQVSRDENAELRRLLEEMRTEYHSIKEKQKAKDIINGV